MLSKYLADVNYSGGKKRGTHGLLVVVVVRGRGWRWNCSVAGGRLNHDTSQGITAMLPRTAVMTSSTSDVTLSQDTITANTIHSTVLTVTEWNSVLA